MKRKILFVDRDGTLIREPVDEQIDSLEKLLFLPGVFAGLRQLVANGNYLLVMVSNQDGLGTEKYPRAAFEKVQKKLLEVFEDQGIVFDDILIDASFPEEESEYRKPNTGMVQKYLRGNYDIANSIVIGDRKSDIQLARNLGCKAAFIRGFDEKLPEEYARYSLAQADDWWQLASLLSKEQRSIRLQRITSETQLDVILTLDGSVDQTINTGLGFFDHMLQLMAFHAGIGLTLQGSGDLWVDEHHLVEDAGLLLGEAFKEALGKKHGLSRYGFVLPMDESKAAVSLDFSGRPFVKWEVSFLREKVGTFPTEMAEHFFYSFCQTAGLTLHVEAEGSNEHHKLEAIFKAVGRSFRQALQLTTGSDVPSSKGIL
ncbi:MAG: bifunctional histidinol-phosphatase/imidazoleglycerol-phosphate dehydratase HisB [Bacteroidales bacterium]